MLIGRTNSSHNPLEPKFKLLDRREILKGDAYSIACGGKYKIFQKVYKQYFSGNKELMQNSRHSDGTCRIPDTTSLKETIALAYSLMRRRRAICSQRCLMNAENVCISLIARSMCLLDFIKLCARSGVCAKASLN